MTKSPKFWITHPIQAYPHGRVIAQTADGVLWVLSNTVDSPYWTRLARPTPPVDATLVTRTAVTKWAAAAAVAYLPPPGPAGQGR